MSIYIRKASAITAGGHDVQQTLASLRSGLDFFREIPFLGESEQNLQAAPIEHYAEGLGGIYRYEALVLKALRPCLADISTPKQQNRTVIFLGLPRSERPGVPDELSTMLTQRLVSRLDGINVAIQPVPFGRTSVFFSLQKVQEFIRQGIFGTFIVGGVDTLLNANSLRGLSAARLLKEEWDGFIPGEAAAFLQVSSKPGVGCWGRPAVTISGVGTANETADGTADNPLVGKGVLDAFKGAMSAAGLPESEVHLCINDVNGARAAFEDEAFGQIRFFRSPREQGHIEVWHPASYIGETGAAVGAIELIWGSAALELGFAPGPGILASTSEAQFRAAVYLRYDAHSVRDISQFKIRVGAGSPILHLKKEESRSDEYDPGLRLTDVDDLQHHLAEENFAELSWLISMREHHHRESGDPWADIEEFEERLVAHLDALAWSGNLARELAIEFLLSEEMEDVAAATMVLLSVRLNEHRWNLLLELATKSDEPAQAMISVLPHLPKETAEPLLTKLAFRGTLHTRSEAIRALTIAGWVSDELIKRLVQEASPELIVPIVEAAGGAGYSQLWYMIAPYIEAQSQQLTGMALCAAMAICPKNTRVPRYDYALLPLEGPITCALVSLRDGVSFLGQLHDKDISVPLIIEAIGWSGEPNAKPMLMRVLEFGNDVQKTAAANALYRIYGCDLKEEVEISVSEPEDEEEEIVEIERLSQDPTVWQEALHVFEQQQRGNTRLRHGQLWTKQSAIRHLQRPEGSYSERLIAAWEFAIVNQKPLPIHPLQFIDKQKAALSILIGT